MSGKTVQWIPSSDENANNKKNITHVQIVAHYVANQTAAGPSESTTPKTNHWLIHLTTARNQSIQVDATPNFPSMKMTIMCSVKPYDVTDKANKIIPVVPLKDLTVKAFFDLIKEHKYDQYKFTENGTGCRYWTYCVVKLLRTQKLISEADFREAENALQKVWKDDKPLGAGNQTTLESQKGTFTG